MTLSEFYRMRAAALGKQAKYASEPVYKERFARMARAYERLAEESARQVRVYEMKTKADETVQGRS